MKKFIIKCGVALCIIVAIISICEILARRVPNDYSMKNSLMERAAPSIKTLVLGNSQFYFGVNPEYFDKPTFNLAHVSQPLNMDAFLFEKFRPQMDSLQNIIFCISYFSPFSYWESGGSGEAWRIKHYHLYYGYPVKWYDLANRIELYNLNYRHDVRWIKALVRGSVTYTDSLGFGRNYLKFHTHNWEDCRIEVKIHTNTELYSSATKEIVCKNHDLISTIAKNNKNCKAFLVIPPAWHTYRELIDKNQMSMVIEFCETLQNENSNIVFLDLFDDPRFDADCFADAYHLSEAGAERLSLILNEIIENAE